VTVEPADTASELFKCLTAEPAPAR
jgi:hypothetical protein